MGIRLGGTPIGDCEHHRRCKLVALSRTRFLASHVPLAGRHRIVIMCSDNFLFCQNPRPWDFDLVFAVWQQEEQI